MATMLSPLSTQSTCHSLMPLHLFWYSSLIKLNWSYEQTAP
jgi:hypothetical protein